jgi:alpha-amylase
MKRHIFFILVSAVALFPVSGYGEDSPQAERAGAAVRPSAKPVPGYASQPGRPRKDMRYSVMMQGFHWESHKASPWWLVIANNAKELAQAGFDMIWLPPSQQAASDEGYIPVQLYNQNSLYGTDRQLKTAIASLHANNILVLADVVINHRVGSSNWADFTNPSWGPETVCSNDEWPYAKGAPDTGAGFPAARDIDHTNAAVNKSISDWMLWLRNTVGYDGWRYDYVKGYAGKFAGHYTQTTMPVFSVGEVWTDLSYGHRQLICDWINSTGGQVSAFDFTTKGMLQYAVATREYWRLRDAQGRPSGLIGWWPEKAVTFIDNHDTGPSTGGGQNHWPFPAENIMQGYAYILTHPGIPCVYWVHYFDWSLKGEIRTLITIRKRQGINAVSPITILVADSAKYAAMVNNNTVVKIGPGSWAPGQGWELATSGKDYAVWTR